MVIPAITNIKAQYIQNIIHSMRELQKLINEKYASSNLALRHEWELEDLTRHLQDAIGVLTVDYEPADHDVRQAHFRCCRPDKYPHGTPETSMQGHYMWADDEDDARRHMVRLYPGERIIVRRCATPDTGD